MDLLGLTGYQLLQKHSNILVYGYRVRDLPSVRYRGTRGKYDLKSVLNRFSSRSKYGCKNLFLK